MTKTLQEDNGVIVDDVTYRISAGKGMSLNLRRHPHRMSLHLHAPSPTPFARGQAPRREWAVALDHHALGHHRDIRHGGEDDPGLEDTFKDPKA